MNNKHNMQNIALSIILITLVFALSLNLGTNKAAMITASVSGMEKITGMQTGTIPLPNFAGQSDSNYVYNPTTGEIQKLDSSNEVVATYYKENGEWYQKIEGENDKKMINFFKNAADSAINSIPPQPQITTPPADVNYPDESIKIYTTPDDPLWEYRYVNGHWETRKKGKMSWISLKDNTGATTTLNTRFPEARSPSEGLGQQQEEGGQPQTGAQTGEEEQQQITIPDNSLLYKTPLGFEFYVIDGKVYSTRGTLLDHLHFNSDTNKLTLRTPFGTATWDVTNAGLTYKEYEPWRTAHFNSIQAQRLIALGISLEKAKKKFEDKSPGEIDNLIKQLEAKQAARERRRIKASYIREVLYPGPGALEIESWIESWLGDVSIVNMDDLPDELRYIIYGYEHKMCDMKHSTYFIQDSPGYYATGAFPDMGLMMFVNGKRTEYKKDIDWDTNCRVDGKKPKWFPTTNSSSSDVPVALGYLYKISWHIANVSEDVTYTVHVIGSGNEACGLENEIYSQEYSVNETQSMTISSYRLGYYDTICIKFNNWEYDGSYLGKDGTYKEFPPGCTKVPTSDPINPGLGEIKKEETDVQGIISVFDDDDGEIEQGGPGWFD